MQERVATSFSQASPVNRRRLVLGYVVILYMFLVGLDLNVGLLRSRAHATVAISHASIVVPFLLGTAMAVTAFPVLARILTDRRVEKGELGVVALSCAAADDITAWCLLAFMVGLAKAEVGDAVRTVLLALGYLVLMALATTLATTPILQCLNAGEKNNPTA